MQMRWRISSALLAGRPELHAVCLLCAFVWHRAA
jgi:hypothetical protein